MNVFSGTVLPSTAHYIGSIHICCYVKLTSDLLALLLKWHRKKLVALWEEKWFLYPKYFHQHPASDSQS